MPTRRAVALSVLAVTGLATAGGSPALADEAAKSPRQILADVTANLAKVRSMHIEGTEVDKDGRTTLSADISASGSTDMRAKLGGQQLRIRAIGKQLYFKGSRSFWKGSGVPSSAVSALTDRWVKMPASAAGADSLAKELQPRALARCLGTDLGTIRKGPVTKVDGKPAVVLIDAGDKPGTSPGRLYVANAGTPLPLRVMQTGPSRAGGKRDAACGDAGDTTRSSDLRFSNYNKRLRITAPAGARDLETLVKQAVTKKT
jgi:hypothetical protein